MEDLKKKINFDSTLLYYSTPNENKDDQLKSSLMNMETYNSTNRKYVCTICGKRFFTNNSLTAHMEHHSPDEPVSADKDKDDSNSDWKNRFVLNKGISCNKVDCNFIALDGVDYNKHLANCEGVRVTKDKNNDAFCELCDCYFSCENYFKAHSILQHPENSPDISLQEQDEKNTKISDPVCLYLQENKSANGNSTKNNTTYSMYPDTFVNKKRSKDAESGSEVSLLHSSERETLPVNEDTNNKLNHPDAEILSSQTVKKELNLNDIEKISVSDHVVTKNTVDSIQDAQNENQLTNENTGACGLTAFCEQTKLKYPEPAVSEHVLAETTEIVKDTSSSKNSVNDKEVSNAVARNYSDNPKIIVDNENNNDSKNSDELKGVQENKTPVHLNPESKGEKNCETNYIENVSKITSEAVEENYSVIHSGMINDDGGENRSKYEVNSCEDMNEVNGSRKNVCKIRQDITTEPALLISSSVNNKEESTEENEVCNVKKNSSEVLSVETDVSSATPNAENNEKRNYPTSEKDKSSALKNTKNNEKVEENRQMFEKDTNIVEFVQIKTEEPVVTSSTENKVEEERVNDVKDSNTVEIVQHKKDGSSATAIKENNDEKNTNIADVVKVEADEPSATTNTGNNVNEEDDRHKDEIDTSSAKVVQMKTDESSVTMIIENNEEEAENSRKDEKNTQIKTDEPSVITSIEKNEEKENCSVNKTDIVLQIKGDESLSTMNTENKEKETCLMDTKDTSTTEVLLINRDELTTMNTGNKIAPENKHDDVRHNVDIVNAKPTLSISEEEYLGVEKRMDQLFQEDVTSKKDLDVTILPKSGSSEQNPEATKSGEAIQSANDSLQSAKTIENVKKTESKKSKKCSTASIATDRSEVIHECRNKKYLKPFNQKEQKKKKSQNKSEIIHSTPKSEIVKEKVSSFGSAKTKNRPPIKKSIPAVNSEDLNIKQRSVRQRKKLILPDYEYGFDNKNIQPNFISSSSKRTLNSFVDTSEASYTSKEENDSFKDRGKPLKRTADSSDIKESKFTSFNESVESGASYSTPKKKKKNLIDDQAEEFSLNTTVIESENSSSFNESYHTKLHSLSSSLHEEMIHEEEDQQNDDDSWLKKVDFSEHTAFDAWTEEPTKKGKNGRSRKIKPGKVYASGAKNVTKKIQNSLTRSGDSDALKKPGKRTEVNHIKKDVKHILNDTDECFETEISMIDDELDNEPLANRKKKLDKFRYHQQNTSSTNKSSFNHVSPKRGRPCKANPTCAISDSVSSRTSFGVTGANYNKLQKTKSTTDQKIRQEKYSPKKESKASTFKKLSTGAIYEKYSNFSKGLVKKSLKGHVEKKDSVNDGDLASTKDPGSNKKSGKSSTVGDNTHHQAKSAVKGKLVKGSTPKKSEIVIHKEIHVHPTKVKRRKQNLLHNLELSPKKGKSDGHNRVLDIKRVSNNAVTSENVLRKSEELVNAADCKMKDLNLTATIKTEPQSSDNENMVLPDAKVSQPVLTKRIKKSVKKTLKEIEEENLASDITKEMDEALYQKDIRNRNRYIKVFKKQTFSPKKGEHPDSLVTCGRCKKKMTLLHYTINHQFSHYFLCWLEGEEEVNMNDDSDVTRILQAAINQEALRKKAIRLMCEKCEKTMKSVIGYVSHVRFCKKGVDEEELLEKCTLCGRGLKPSSIRHHYIKFHGVAKFTVSDSRILPDIDNTTNIKRHSLGTPSAPRKNILMGFERVSVQKTDILHDEEFWKSLKTSYDLYMCMGLSCRHMTLSKDDLKSHILSCGANFCEFSCSLCPYKTKYESEIIYHSKNKCKESSDVEDNDDEKENENENEKENENDDTVGEKPKPTPERRVSTRVKKRRYMFDFDDEEELEKSKAKISKNSLEGDSDFHVKSESENESEEDSDFMEKRSKFSKKKLENSSNKALEEGGLRFGFIQLYSGKIADPLNYTVEIRLKTFSTSPTHTNLKVDINEWETFPISDLPKYSPMQYKSMKVSFDSPSFSEYKLFQSDVIKGVPVCYTGGPVWSLAWAPLPALVTEQYLAVAGLQHMNHVAEVDKPLEFPSMVQIWKFSSLDNIRSSPKKFIKASGLACDTWEVFDDYFNIKCNDIHKPSLAWAIAHNYGIVWSMEWCPSGGFDNSSIPYRLGILALSTSAGCVVIYSVPRLDCGGETRSIVANPEPDLILKIRNKDVQCTRVVWQRNNPHNVVFGGFSNGIVALWNICTTSTILKNGKILYPYKTIEAHKHAITVLDVHWMDNSRFLLTGSHDRVLKYWDIEDLSGPTFETEKSTVALSAVWMQHWITTVNGNDMTNVTDPMVYVGHPRDLVERKKALSNLRDTFWSVAYSDWNDTVAFSSNGGNVSVFAAKHLSSLTFKQPDLEKMVTETKLLSLPPDQRNDSQNVEKDTGLPRTDDPYDCSEIVKNYGIQFCNRVKAKPGTNDLNFAVEKCNVTSVNKVSWNQNYNSFNWLALGYECGFVRVMRMERFDKHHLTKFYKMNENSSITLV